MVVELSAPKRERFTTVPSQPSLAEIQQRQQLEGPWIRVTVSLAIYLTPPLLFSRSSESGQ